ncbi:translation elongation factor Ts [Pelagibacterium xiamenense]|uniref:translation elongation factor Ts n=1 Tax=Pelagibacterium xiamenense TaxID=2901140 RepID=UPI001E385E4C|nr:translation elongation factor Ts [Pelagibacterium xiamenense]MCD7060920.1 translation elongation factor Ts [Pelagibacterium xiamenense]
MSISAADVKQLREMTGVGMMDCKKALAETNGDIEAAVDWLRTKGLAKAAKKADRVAAEGLVGIATDGNRAAIVEINSETDFVARNEQFQSIVRNAAKLALDVNGDVAALAEAEYPDSGRTLSGELTEAIAKIGENMTLRRAAMLEVGEGVIGSYVHSAIADGLGRIGVLVGLESAGDKAKLEALGKQVAMHIAATKPLSLSADDLDPEAVERERAVFSEQAKASGKPDNIVEKMVEGRIRKYYEEVTLLAQTFVIDGENSVEKAVKNAESDVGAPIKVTGFVLYSLGEGVEKQESDFAAEVAAAAGTA